MAESKQNIEDLYPLSPMQEGMLFHALHSPRSNLYIEQMSLTLVGRLDAERLRRCWEAIVGQHAVLRTRFVWKKQKRPVQAVFKKVDLDWRSIDLTDKAAGKQLEATERLKEEDRSRGFNLEQAALSRWTLIRKTDDQWVLIWTWHHILMDGWSVSLILKTLRDHYQGETQQLPKGCFGDYIRWLAARDGALSRAFWKKELVDVHLEGRLPALYRRTEQSEPIANWAETEIRFDDATYTAIREATRSARVTLNTLLNGAWVGALSWYCGTDNVVCGVTVSGRPPDLDGVEGIVGLFINTVPAAVQWSRSSNVAEWLQRLQRSNLERLEHGYLPLSEVKAAAGIVDRDELFESLFVFENYPIDQVLSDSAAELNVAGVEIQERTNYPLNVVVTAGRELKVKLLYDADRYDARLIESLLETTQSVSLGMARGLEGTLGQARVLSSSIVAEAREMGHGAAAEGYRGVLQRFADHVVKAPSRPAVEADDVSLDYRGLNTVSSQLALRLRERLSGTEPVVAVVLERSAALVVAQLGILKASAVFLPIDPSQPDERMRGILESANVGVVLTSEKELRRLSRLVPTRVDVLPLTADQLCCVGDEKVEGEIALPDVPAEQLAYIIYTSGSTGHPKGVSVTHRGLANLVSWHVAQFSLTEEDRESLVAGVGFDASVWEIWPCLCAGGCLVPAPSDALESPARWNEWASSKQVTVAFLPTPLTDAALESGRFESGDVRLILTGGDRLNRFPQDSLGFQLVNNYGPSENAVVATSGEVSVCLSPQTLPSIGRPISGVVIRVLDDEMNVVPPGVPGELCLGGDSLARGYLGRPDLTAERFVPDPFSVSGGERLYRTGDLVRFLQSGELEFLRRIDQQVQIRGHRVELGEIASTLMAFPGVSNAAANVVARERGEPMLVAWVASADSSLTEALLRDWMAERLPASMRPQSISVLSSLPLTPNGKIDNRALPMPERDGVHNVKPPRDATEAVICGVWSEVLDVDVSSVDDDFFSLGGHSLVATRAVSRVNEVFDTEFAVRTLFESATVAEFARRVREQGGTKRVVPIETTTAEGDDNLPLSYAQERIWFLAQFDPTQANYNIVGALALNQPVDLDVLKRSLLILIQRHECLRTTFHEADDGAIQRIHPSPTELNLRQTKLMEVASADKRESEIQAWMRADAAESFDLETGPLIQFRWLEPSSEESLESSSGGVLIVVLHHIISDGWSMGVFVRELNHCYAQILADGQAELPPLPIAYRDFAVWQRQEARQERDRLGVDAAIQAIDGAATVIELPTDYPRHSSISNAGAEVRFECDGALTRKLHTLSRRHRATIVMTLQAAFGLMLSRLSGQRDILLGNTSASRARLELEGLMGCFVNLIPVRLQVDSSKTFADLLPKVRENCLEAYTRDDVPFEALVGALDIERNLSVDPLVQVAFTFQNTPPAQSRRDGVLMDLLTLPTSTAKFDLELEMFEAEGQLRGRFEYRSDLFAPNTVAVWAELFVHLLRQVVESPKKPLRSLGWAPSSEVAAIRETLTGPPTGLGRKQTLELIDEVAATQRAKVAIADERGEVSYGELVDRSCWAANRLLEARAEPESIVGLLTRRSTRHLEVTLGVLRAGCAFLPLDPKYPVERIVGLLEESGASLLVVDSEFKSLADHVLNSMNEAKPKVLIAEELTSPAESVSPRRFKPVEARNLAYVIFTSGSTGRPKGAMVEHQGMLNHLLAKVVDLELTERDVVAQNASQCFDISVWQFLAALLVGGQIRVYDDVASDPWALFNEVERDGVTVLEIVPSVLSLFLAEEKEQASSPQLRQLRWLIPTGEVFPPEQARIWLEARPHAPVVNAYGPTECSDDVTHHIMRDVPPETVRNIPIGKPLQNLSIYVLDEAFQMVPRGVLGELYVGGIGVGRGYLKRPSLTAKTFVPDPFSSVAGAAMYRTGDKGRLLPTGELEYVGRLDHQVKVRGFRIELGEVEAALRNVEGVSEAAVITWSRMVGAPLGLYAYYVAKRELAAGPIREVLAQSLPAHCVPDGFMQLDAMPLNHSGKLDRKRLPEPDRGAENAIEESPASETEAAVLSIWKSVLEVERIGLQEDFFQLGGHSLMAAQVVSRCRRQFNVEFPARLLFEHPTVSNLASAIERLPKTDASSDGGISRSAKGSIVPPSFAQRRMWFMERLEGVGGTYHISRAVTIRGELDLSVLEAVLRQLVERHEALRTSIGESGDGPWLEVNQAEQFELITHRLEDRSLLASKILSESQRPFDLATDIPFRTSVFDLGGGEWVLVMTVHHVAADGWSLNILSRELVEGYSAVRDGREPRLPSVSASYLDFARWQHQRLVGAPLERLQQFWVAYLAEAPPELELPFDRPRQTQQTFNGASVAFQMDTRTAVGVRELGRRHGSSLFMVLSSVYASLLARYSGQDDIVVGIPVAGRSQEAFEPLVGLFVNTVPLRLRVRSSWRFDELLEQTRASAMDVFAHEELPLDLIIDAVEPERSLGRHPLFQTMFILQTPDSEALALPGALVTPYEFDAKVSRFDLTFSLEENRDSLTGIVEYNTDLFDSTTIERLIRSFQSIANQIVVDEGALVASLPLNETSTDQALRARYELLDEYSGRPASFLERFAEVVSNCPAAVAVICEETRLTYLEIDRLSNQVAIALKNAGVKRDSRVAVCLNRGAALLPTLIGVWKAGGAYVPLDPGFPQSRLKYILEDSAAAAVVTESSYWDEWLNAAWADETKVVILDPATGALGNTPEAADATSVCPSGGRLAEQAAYILYTSGSTGRPKGVCIADRAMLNFLDSMIESPGIAASDCLLAVTTISFDISVLELFAPLLQGASVSLADRDSSLDGRRLWQRVVRDGVTVMQGTPATWRLMIDAASPASRPLKALCGGEALTPALASELLSAGHDVWNMYGPTETTVWSAIKKVDEGQYDAADKAIALGEPIANTSIRILDSQLQPAPIGVFGQLFIGGAGLARGYHERPALTAERFVPDPYGVPGTRLYATGDKARIREDGELEFAGRIDFQVKVRGFRIELGEIEAVICTLPGVRNAIVQVRQMGAGEDVLVAYLDVALSAPLDTSAVKSHVSNRLPDYMNPSFVEILDGFPLLPNGKVDRSALPDPIQLMANDRTAPRNALERQLVEIWSEVSGIEEIGIDDSFFDLGGNSLGIMRLSSLVVASLGVEVPVSGFFTYPTVRLFAANAVPSANDLVGEIAPAVIDRRAGEDLIVRQSTQQERLWFLDRLNPDSPTYNLVEARHLSGQVQLEALQRGVDALVQRHESLRTTFEEADGVPLQRVHAALSVDIEYVSMESSDLRGEAFLEFVQRIERTPFRLTDGPLMRIAVGIIPGRWLGLADVPSSHHHGRMVQYSPH